MCAVHRGLLISHSPLWPICIKIQWTVKQFHYYTNEIRSTTNNRNPDSTGYTIQSCWTISVDCLCFIQLSVLDCQCICDVCEKCNSKWKRSIMWLVIFYVYILILVNTQHMLKHKAYFNNNKDTCCVYKVYVTTQQDKCFNQI